MKTTSQIHSAASVPPYRWCYLALSSFGLLFVGIIYAWSIFKVPLQDAFGWDAPSLAVNYSLSVAFLCIGGLVGGLLDKKLSTRSLLLFAAFLSFVGFTVTSRLDGSSITLLYLAYGIVAGSGIGISYNTLLAVGNSWFPDKKGLSSGILMMCFGLSTMLLGKVAAAMFEMEAFGWRKTFFFVGAIIAVILVICALFLKKPGADVVFQTTPAKAGKSKTKTAGSATNKVADSAYVKASATQSSSAKPISQRDYTAAETMRSPAFWIFFVYGTLTCSVGMVVINFALDLSLTLGASVALATTLVGVLSACNGLGRIICGILYDTTNCRTTMLFVTLVTTGSALSILLALQTGSLLLGVLGMCLAGISYGSVPTLSSAFLIGFYGIRDFATNYSVANLRGLIGSFVPTIAGFLLQSSGTYVTPFLLLLGISIISIPLNFMIRRP
ncbi:MFS transporter [Lachnospiraceae bacterium HCP1S3_A8]|nr:MFS transporter [Lachnospiraceae bacterium]